MKKGVLLLILLSVILISTKVNASTYNYFEEIEVVGSGKLISEMSNRELSSYEKKVSSRKFMGWQTYDINKNMKVKYISETHFSYYNDGYTPIDYQYKLKLTDTETFHVAATGTIGLNNSKDGKGFKNGLSSTLKIENSFKKQSSIEETTTLNFKIDPGTQVNLYTYGEGKITNGVAADYFFWIRRRIGAYEYFIVTTQYQRLEKVKI